MSGGDVEKARWLFTEWFDRGRRMMERELDPGADLADFNAEMFTEDAEYREDPSWPGAGTYRGRQPITSRVAEYLEIFGPGSRLDLDEVIDAGDRILVCFHLRLAGVQSGAAVDQQWAYLVRMRAGRVADMEAFNDVDRAKQEAGLQ